MTLPTSQQRALNRIEKTLADEHPGLGPLFAMFTSLVSHETMPVTEQVKAQPWPRRVFRRRAWRRRAWRRRQMWRLWPAAATIVGLAMAIGVLFMLSLTLPGPPVCPGTVPPVAARLQPVPTARASCAAQPSRTPAVPAR